MQANPQFAEAARRRLRITASLEAERIVYSTPASKALKRNNMKILAFAGSNNSKSINKWLATYAANLIEGAEIEVLDLNDFEMPIYSSDREAAGGIPELAAKFFAKIGESDAIIISFAEHNGSYTAAYKNIFDWSSRISQKVFQNKPMLLLSTSPGPGGAQSVLASAKTSAPYFAGDVKASLSIPNFYANFDQETGAHKNTEIYEQLLKAVQSLL